MITLKKVSSWPLLHLVAGQISVRHCRVSTATSYFPAFFHSGPAALMMRGEAQTSAPCMANDSPPVRHSYTMHSVWSWKHTTSDDRPRVCGEVSYHLTVLYEEKNSISNERDLFTLSRVSRGAAAAGEPCPMLPVIASPGWANQKGPLTFSTEGVGFKCTLINDQKKYPVSTGNHYLTVLHFRWVKQLFILRKWI